MSEKPESNAGTRMDATGEFFVFGSPIQTPRASYIRRKADDQLYDAVLAGRFAHVIAPDRSGKSSLIAATSARLFDSGCKVAVIDLEQISERDGGTDAGRWYYSIAYRLLRQFRLKFDLQTWWQDKAMISNRQRLVEFYAEVILANLAEPVVIFIDEIQCIAEIPFEEHLLASIRAAHNSRITDPEFSRLSFVMLGECDPYSLVSNEVNSPFAVSQEVRLNDFTRKDLNVFKGELNLDASSAEVALDCIFDWTGGQPYLTQKLARSFAREAGDGDIDGSINRIVMHQLAGRAALHSEPHMSHIHRQIVNDRKMSEALLTAYGKMRKGVPILHDPESPVQRRLFALGLVTVNSDGYIKPRNRIYARVFTAKWANENLPIHWRGPVMAVGIVLVMLAIPFWYTQLLPSPHVRILSSTNVELSTVADAWESMRTFPGHKSSADNLYRSHLRIRSQSSTSSADIARVHMFASRLPDGRIFADELAADFWDRAARGAMRNESRDDALLAAIDALVVATPARRQRAANLIGDDYPQLIGTVPATQAKRVLFDAENNLLSFANEAQLTQWSMANNSIQERASWSLTALEVTPLVRRLVTNLEGSVRSVSMKLSISHSRSNDLRIKLIAPSGRTVELESLDRPSPEGVMTFPGAVLSEMRGEPVAGTWSLSIRDESTAATGTWSRWELTLNGQTHTDLAERPLPIPDPEPRESNDVWFSANGRYAIARAIHSDSARLWDLLYAQPARTISVPANERVLGLSANAEFLLSAGQDSFSLWRTSTGRRHLRQSLKTAGSELTMSDDGRYLFIQSRGQTATKFVLWSVETEKSAAELTVAGSPALFTVSADGTHIAVADYDRAVRIWNLRENRLLAQIALEIQPTKILLSFSGAALGVIHGEQGVSLWSTSQPEVPLVRDRKRSDWSMAFSRSGARFLAGNSIDGFQVYRSQDGAIAGPPVGSELNFSAGKLLAFSADESTLVTASANGISRFWRTPAYRAMRGQRSQGHQVWQGSGDSVTAIANGGKRLALGDYEGHVHIVDGNPGEGVLEQPEDINFIGHHRPVSALSFSADGSLVASSDAAGNIRVWDADSGQPRPFDTNSVHEALSMHFSSDNSLLAVLGRARVWLIDTVTGKLVVEIELGDPHNAMAFVSNTQIYLAAEDGTLRGLSTDRTSRWSLRAIWSGDVPLRHVAVSPQQQHVVVVDEQHKAFLLNINAGTIGTSTLQLPGAVEDIMFSPNESRIIFRTARWIHRARLSRAGLTWLDALRAPKALTGSGIVLDKREGSDEIDPMGGDVALLTRYTGFAEVAELHFSATDKTTLIGNHEQLLAEWKARLGRTSGASVQ